MDADRRHEPSDGARPSTGLQARADKLQAELLAMFGEMLSLKQQSGALRRIPKASRVAVELELLASGELRAGSHSLFEQLSAQVTSLAEGEARFPRGHVHCYRCNSFQCEHAEPEGPRSVFAGYSETGEPAWREFASVLLDARDPRVEDLFQEPPTPVTRVQEARELNAKQLPIYGKWSTRYRVLGQVMLGYVQLGGRDGERGPVALCFQAVQTSPTGAPRLNVIGTLPDSTPAVETLESRADPRIATALRTARQQLRDVALIKVARRRRAAVTRSRCAAILQRLARNLERIFRQKRRRTRHSQTRHLDRRRPAARALHDALNAGRPAFFRDVEECTWVVLGPKNRVHVFNDRGLHVTSVVYQGESIRQRTTRGKWKPPHEDELAAFQRVLRKASSQ